MPQLMCESEYVFQSELRPEHGISLVCEVSSGNLFVRKELRVFDRGVYMRLLESPVEGLPRIEKIYDDGDMLTVIEEFLEGKTLEQLLDEGKSFSEAEVKDIGIALCGILAGLHNLKPPVIHRDIKPSNVMQLPDGGLRLLDMNAARFDDGEKERDTVLLGTRGYAAPEQYGFGSSDPRTDIYGLGMLLKELLPNDEKPGKEKRRLEKIIEKCICMDPDERWQSAAELEAALKGESIENPRRRFLPPGFRSGKLINMLLAVPVYALIIALALTTEFDNYSGTPEWVVRIFMLFILLSPIVFVFNYGGIHKRLPLTNSANRALRIAGVLIYSVLAPILIIALMSAVLLVLLS